MRGDLHRLITEGIAYLNGGGTVAEYMDRSEVQRLPDAEREELDAILHTTADLLQLRRAATVPRASRSVVAANRARFLSEAVRLREKRRAQPTWGWLRAPTRIWRGVVAATLALALLLSLGGGAVRAAAGSLPGSPLYTLKLVVEDTRLTLAFSQAERARLYLRFANERTWEIASLAQKGHPVSKTVVARMNQQLQGAVWAAQAVGGHPARELLGLVIENSNQQVEVLRQSGATAGPETRVLLDMAMASARQSSYLAQQALQQNLVAEATLTATPVPTLAPTEGVAIATPVVSDQPAAPTATPLPVVVSATPPAASVTPVPSGTPTPQWRAIPTPYCSETPTPTATPSVTPTPLRAIPTPYPSETPGPSATPEPPPTHTPEPTPTNTPEPTPTDTPTPAPTDTPTPVFSITINAHPNPVPAGYRVYYDIYVRNDGEVPLTNVGVVFKWSPVDCAYLPPDYPSEVTWALGTLEPHTWQWLRVILNTRNTCGGSTLTNEAIMTCDQGAARVIRITNIIVAPVILVETPTQPAP